MTAGQESPKEGVERLVREGRFPWETVSEAEKLWHDRLCHGVRMPNGETVGITVDDVYHVIVDPRIGRKPQRIEQILASVVEIRSSERGRRLACSRWHEAGKVVVGYAILGNEGGLVTLHVSSERKLVRMLRRGDLLWRL
ncbi:MAG: hypothetical protein M1380_03275 [Chloroflexi bacterium]|nr:hypothetical protein [Chloroflexota bacterium]